jgi:hypothetical protein
MTQKEGSTPVSNNKTSALRQSAPELPHAVAKQYGLHNEPHNRVAGGATGTGKTGNDALDQPAPVISNAKTDEAVDDILKKDGDDLLATQEEHMAVPVPPKKGFWHKIGHFFAAWWRKKWARWITIIILVIGIAAAFIVPGSRYALLNTFGVRSSASVVVLDDTTQLPLKNVTVSLGDNRARTDSDGKVRFKNLKLGNYHLRVNRLAFAPQTKDVTIGWGSNPLGEFKLDATGIQYTLSVKDYLSGRPIRAAEAENADLVAQSDAKGKIILTVEDTEQTTLEVTLTSPGYRTEQVTINAAKKVTANVALVPAQKAVYVSDVSGTYDVYSSDLDGKNKKRLLKGTGIEKADISLVVSPDGGRAALVSTRDNIRDKDGFLVSTLTIIDVHGGTAAPVDRSQKIQLIDWIDNKLIYRKTLAGASASSPQRNRIVAFNYEANARVQLASANMFTYVASIGGKIFYAPSSTDPQAALGLFRASLDGKNRTRITDKEIWTGVRTAYNTIRLQTPDAWLAYDIPSRELTKTSAPGSINSLTFANDPSGKLSAWVDTGDNKAMLRLYTIAQSANKTLAEQDGLTTPVRWAGQKAIIYRVATDAGIADYVVSPDGGKPRKIANVTPTYGF